MSNGILSVRNAAAGEARGNLCHRGEVGASKRVVFKALPNRLLAPKPHSRVPVAVRSQESSGRGSPNTHFKDTLQNATVQAHSALLQATLCCVNGREGHFLDRDADRKVVARD